MREPRAFKTKWFQRFARKAKIADVLLLDAVARAEEGRWMPTLATA
jgi:hypothetical protein